MTDPTLPRSSGVLLHPTSLPGPFGVGDLGPNAYRWVETLAAAKQSWWQILPLGPTGGGGSPYQSFSTFAGNTTLLSPELLARVGLVSEQSWAGRHFPDDRVDFRTVAPFKAGLVREAWGRFRGGAAADLKEPFAEFCERESAWLDDYAAFMAIRDALGGAPLDRWPADLRKRVPAALAATSDELADEIRLRKFGEFLFDRQWTALRAFAAGQGVRLIGDVPIFVAADSADVWVNPHLFLVDADLRPKVFAGVPPDYFSENGQNWGNPIYDWNAMAADGYRWWVARARKCLQQTDIVRLDHFRGFAQAYHIPADAENAKTGIWTDGSGAALFHVLRSELGGLPFIAEDLGVITPDVDALRTGLGLPGMRVIQFMLGGAENPHLPHNYDTATVVYTGTHDNDTTAGWFGTLSDADRWYLHEYVGHHVAEPAWEMIRLAWSSVAKVAITPLQDLFGVRAEGRMNTPGVADGNWGWRVRYDQFRGDTIERLAALTARTNRIPPKAKTVLNPTASSG